MKALETHAMSDRAFFRGAALLFTIILLPSLLIPACLPGPSAGLQVFYDWANMLMNGAAPLLAAPGQPAPLLSLDERVPNLLAVGLCDLASAVLVLRIAWKAYGREAGFAAGALFTAAIALPQGSIAAEGALALTLTLASAYLLLSRKYLAAGVCAGLSAWLAPYAAILLPAGLYVAYKANGKGAATYAAIFVLAVLPALALAPGAFAAGAPLLSFAGHGPDALLSAAGVSVALAALTSLLPAALLGLARRRATVNDWYFLFAALAFVSTLLVRQYLNYWFFALPFIALLCAGQWAGKDSGRLK